MCVLTITLATLRCREVSANLATATTTSTSPGPATVTGGRASASGASSTPLASTVRGASLDIMGTLSTRSVVVSAVQCLPLCHLCCVVMGSCQLHLTFVVLCIWDILVICSLLNVMIIAVLVCVYV